MNPFTTIYLGSASIILLFLTILASRRDPFACIAIALRRCPILRRLLAFPALSFVVGMATAVFNDERDRIDDAAALGFVLAGLAGVSAIIALAIATNALRKRA